MIVFPNPASQSERITLYFEQTFKNTMQITISNIKGMELKRHKVLLPLNGKKYMLPQHNFAPGLYTIKVECDGKKGTQRLIIH